MALLVLEDTALLQVMVSCECLLLLDQNVMPSAMLLSLLRRVAGTGNLLSHFQIVILTLVRHLFVLSLVVHVVLVVHA